MLFQSLNIATASRLAAAALGIVTAHSASADVFLRGTQNNWEAEAMLGQGYYAAKDIVTFAGCYKAAFKFDLAGDWSVNYGDFDNTRGFNPYINAMEGHLDQGGSNIEVACGKTYYIYMNYYGSGSSNTYGLRELAAEVPQTLPADTDAAFRKAVRVPQFYGSVAIAGEVLVRDLPGETKIEVKATNASGQTITEQATPYKSLPNGLRLWRFEVSGYIDGIDSIVLQNNDGRVDVNIDPALIQ